jgi:4-carboxymuconolactone decarboxylase
MSAAALDTELQRRPGLRIIADMFGEEIAAQRLDSVGAGPKRLADLLVDVAYGQVWADETLGRRERSLITVALLTALGRDEELAAHLRGARANGCTDEELFETMIHVILYAGFPAGLGGVRILNEKRAEP